jgi:hypothetical protein
MILTQEKLNSDVTAEFVMLDDRCFACGGTLDFPFIYWHGLNGRSLCLHPCCAWVLGRSLQKDANAYLLPLIGKPPPV